MATTGQRRYRFNGFTLSPQRRLLVRDGQEVPLIPRYFDLLLLLVERRHEAIHRREIFDRVWHDVVVSPSALSQAVRTIRRTLGDDSREPRYIRTVSRHGYRFVCPDVVEEADDTSWPETWPAAPDPAASAALGRERLGPPHWIGGSTGGALAGLAAGGLGGLLLAASPGSTAPLALAPVLAVVGAGCGAIGGAGIGAGLAAAEASGLRPRVAALTVGAAAGGGLVGAAVQWLAHGGLTALVGLDIDIGGGLEGLAIGAGAGLGFALAPTHDANGSGSVDPRSRRRAAMVLAILCGLAGLSLALAGRPLVGGTIHALAAAADGSQATLAPLGRLVGEPDFGPISGAIIAFGEAACFGLGLAFGLLRPVRAIRTR